ncbi:MAG: hypothetical protein R3B70_33000 [Polyangiaceae bacterium]
MPFSKVTAMIAGAALLAPGGSGAGAGSGASGAGATGGGGSGAELVVMVVDRDDDDANGVPDREDEKVPESAALFVLKGRPSGRDTAAWIAPDTDAVRVIADGRAVARGGVIPTGARKIALQATRAGVHSVKVLGRALEVRAFELRALDGKGAEVDWARSHASFQRTPPDRLGKDAAGANGDPDALRYVVIGAIEDIPTTLSFLSVAESGAPVDVLQDVALAEMACPAGVGSGVVCGVTVPVRVVTDDIDRGHPLTKERSVKGALGGAIVVQTTEGERLQAMRVGGPRETTAGAIERLRASLRMVLVRPRAGGPPPLGSDDAGAIAAARAEVEKAGISWGACGIGFGPPGELQVTIVDPPKSHLVAVGCDHGLPASGGTLRVRVEGTDVSANIAKGMTPAAAARVLAGAINAVGLSARVSENAPMNAGAGGSADVLVRRRDGTLALVEAPSSGGVSSDATLTACIGRVDLTDGLTHFGDTDAFAGTVEERTLLKAFDDGDPSTIEVLFVPGFAQGGRIGESFIMSDKSAVRNAVVEDRAAIRSDRAAFALAHELGHVLLDEPGHPDDFGPDTPTRLMDSDAANPTAFGPRRLTAEECGRAVRQTGPGAPVQILKKWPFRAIGGR